MHPLAFNKTEAVHKENVSAVSCYWFNDVWVCACVAPYPGRVPLLVRFSCVPECFEELSCNKACSFFLQPSILHTLVHLHNVPVWSLAKHRKQKCFSFATCYRDFKSWNFLHIHIPWLLPQYTHGALISATLPLAPLRKYSRPPLFPSTFLNLPLTFIQSNFLVTVSHYLQLHAPSLHLLPYFELSLSTIL